MLTCHKKVIDDGVRFLSEKDFVDQIWLFGSVANEKANFFSDIDLCVITNRELDKYEIIQLRIAINPEIDLQIKYKQLDKTKQIDNNILREGRLLWRKV